jgi:hypothetical protein
MKHSFGTRWVPNLCIKRETGENKRERKLTQLYAMYSDIDRSKHQRTPHKTSNPVPAI